VIPDDARIEPFVTIYAGVQLGAGVSLEQGAILGRPQRIHSRSRTPRQPEGAPTVIGDGCHIGSATVVVAGARMGTNAHLGDHALLRETAVVGEDAMVGRGAVLSHDTVAGDRTSIQNNVLVGPWTTIEEDVLVSPYVTFVGDPTMGRRARDAVSAGIVVRRACRIGTAAIVFQGVEVGEESVIGAGAMVRADVPPRTVVVGAPARPLRAVADDELLETWRREA
jgi:acetyltransferase-like isoleucine patch superfamily enzyme